MNVTLVKRVMCMLSEAKLPKQFWGETLLEIVHEINFSPTTPLDNEVW